MENELMGKLLNFAKHHLKGNLQFSHVFVVLGNETCDLDSAISSLVYSLLLYHLRPASSIVIPVFNIPRVHLFVKTEVTYCLKKYGLNLDNIICRDEIDLLTLQEKGSLSLTLVDHHALSQSDTQLKTSVTAIIDHRPQDPAWPWSQADLTLLNVASCCTLVAQTLLKQAPQLISPSVAEMLLGTILLDSACLSPEVGKATPLDHQVADQLQFLCDKSMDRRLLFHELKTAKTDVSSLTSAQLLIKDLKVAAGIPIAGLPIKVKDYLTRPDASEAVRHFCEDYRADVCVIYGSKHMGGVATKDLAVFSFSKNQLATQVVAALTNSKEPSLNLQPQPCVFEGFTLFEQLNIKPTRKQILPIVRQVGEKFQEKQDC